MGTFPYHFPGVNLHVSYHLKIKSYQMNLGGRNGYKAMVRFSLSGR